jgi:hypothetical protein
MGRDRRGSLTSNRQGHQHPRSQPRGVQSLPQVKAYFGAEQINTLDTAWEAIRAGEAAGVTTTLGEILGRDPEPFEKTIEEFVKKQRSEE